MSAFEIRRMSLSDLGEVMEVDAASMPAPWSAGVWRSEVSSPLSVYLVAEEPGTEEGIAGQIGAKRIMDELHVTTLAIRPEYRRRGIARSLFEAVLGESPGALGVVLEVRPSNRGARSFYESLGFEESGRRPRYYGDEDALLMSLAL